MIVRLFMILGACLLLSACSDRPSTGSAKQAFERQLGASLNGAPFKISKFQKTNGQALTGTAVESYLVHYSAIVTFPEGIRPECVAEGNKFAGWSCAQSSIFGGLKPQRKGAKVEFTGTVQFEKSERGWLSHPAQILSSTLLEEGEKPVEITFSILSTESAQNMESYWAPVLVDMEKATGLTVKPFFSSNYSALIEAMRFKQTDFGWFSNQSGLEAVRRSNGEVFARTFDPSGIDGYKSVIIVPADSPIRTVQDLLKCDKTLDFGMGDKKSTSGTLAPMTYVFIPAGVKPETCFKTVLTANHQANLFAVAAGRLDAATNNSTAIRLNAERKEGQAEKIRVIWESPTLPEDPIVWRKDLDPAVKEKLRQFFLTYGQGDSADAARQRANLAKISIGGFLPADDTHLLMVREMEATETMLLAEEGGDAAKIAAARKALDGIKAERATLAAKPGGGVAPAAPVR